MVRVYGAPPEWGSLPAVEDTDGEESTAICGIASRLAGDRHVLLLDWDCPAFGLWFVEQRGYRAMWAHKLPAIHLWESSPGSYHGLSLCARSAKEIAEIQRFVHSDKNHTQQGIRNGFWVMRTQDTPGRARRFLHTVGSPYPAEARESDIYSVQYGSVMP